MFENKGIVRLLAACVYFDSFCQRECRSPRLGVLWNDTCSVFHIGKADFLYKNSMSERYKVQSLQKLGIHLPFFRPHSCHFSRLFRPRLVSPSRSLLYRLIRHIAHSGSCHWWRSCWFICRSSFSKRRHKCNSSRGIKVPKVFLI